MMKKNDKVNIFILIDALGWIYIKDRSFLDDVAKTKKLVKSLFGYSSTILPSILTGKYPDEHKHWSIFFYNPEKSLFKWAKTIKWLPKRYLNNRLSRKLVEVISQKKTGYTGYFETYLIPVELLPYFDMSEKRNIYKPGGFENCKSIFDIWKEKNVKYICLSYPKTDREIFRIARERIESENTGVYFIYLADLDRFLHNSCKEIAQVNKAIDWYEKEIKLLIQAAGHRFRKVNFYVFSDHGMTPVESGVDIKTEIDKLGFQIPNEYLPMYDSTMARFWFFSANARIKITEFLEINQYGKMVSDDELKKWRVYFPDKRNGELIFLMNPGCLINPSFMGNRLPQGMHGFNPEIDSADGILVSNREIEEEIKDVTGFFKIMVRDKLYSSTDHSPQTTD